MSEFLEVTVDKFIFKVATDRLYSRDGVWAQQDGNRIRLGITDYRQQLGGDVAFVHLKPVATLLAAGDEFAEVETIKATVSFPSPVAGEIVAVNENLDLAPETVNQDPYGQGWLVRVNVADWAAAQATLLDAQTYLVVMKAQAEEEQNRS